MKTAHTRKISDVRHPEHGDQRNKNPRPGAQR